MEAEERPWGWYRVLGSGEGFLVKELFVKGGERTSLQYHRYREEVWIAVKGKGAAQVGDKKVELGPGVVVKVDRGVKHRIEGLDGGILIVEVWLGEILDERDIVRIEDDYGRT